MKKTTVALLLTLAVLLFASACKAENNAATEPAEQGLPVSRVVGVWAGSRAPFSYLILSDEGGNGTYEILSPDGDMRRGGFIIEESTVVLDGFGADDPERFLALRFDEKKDLMQAEESAGGYTLSRTEIREAQPAPDRSMWYGKYRSDKGVLSVGPGASANALLVALTPRYGASISTSLTIEEEGIAFCDSFRLILSDGAVVLEATESDFSSLEETYIKEG